MLYSDLITELRREVRDFKYLMEELFDGDASTAIFVLKHHPVIENSQQILVGGSLKTENTHYTFDDDLGEITFTAGNIPASSSDNVKCTYRHANFNDTDWINVVNNSIEVYSNTFWTEVDDYTTLDTVANQSDYSLSGISTGIFRLISFQYRTTSSASADVAGSQWLNFTSNYNVTYSRDSNFVRLNPVFQQAGYDIRVRALRKPTTYTTTSSTVDCDADEIKAIKEHAKGQYYMQLAALKGVDLQATTKDSTVSPQGSIATLAKYHFDLAEKYAKKAKKPYPATYIPYGAYGKPN